LNGYYINALFRNREHIILRSPRHSKIDHGKLYYWNRARVNELSNCHGTFLSNNGLYHIPWQQRINNASTNLYCSGGAADSMIEDGERTKYHQAESLVQRGETRSKMLKQEVSLSIDERTQQAIAMYFGLHRSLIQIFKRLSLNNSMMWWDVST
jgi:hypothetical protein